MSNSTTILRTATVTAIFATLSLGAAHANGNAYLKHNYARSAAARHDPARASTAACGTKACTHPRARTRMGILGRFVFVVLNPEPR